MDKSLWRDAYLTWPLIHRNVTWVTVWPTCSIIQFWQLLISLQNLLHVGLHNVHHLQQENITDELSGTLPNSCKNWKMRSSQASLRPLEPVFAVISSGPRSVVGSGGPPQWLRPPQAVGHRHRKQHQERPQQTCTHTLRDAEKQRTNLKYTFKKQCAVSCKKIAIKSCHQDARTWLLLGSTNNDHFFHRHLWCHDA